ncbi:MAG: rhodanese-like domain-containing protein [Gallionellaceae bacterium]
MTQTISRKSIKNALDSHEAITLVEALPERYFNDAHLPGAIQINHDEIDAKAASMLPDKSARIVLYCSNLSCTNSGKAALRLEQLGYTNVFKYAEGKQNWIEAGLPIEQLASI